MIIVAAVVAAAIRTFVAEEPGRIPSGRITPNSPRMVANLAAGWLVYAVLDVGSRCCW